MRAVRNIPNREGVYELGPCTDGAHGLGDTLTITPLAGALGKKAVMLMPPHMARLKFLFRDLCPVQITDNYPEFPWKATGHAAKQKLEMFGLLATSPIPKIHVSFESIRRAKALLRAYPSPLAFCPTCSHAWEHVRQRPPVFWKPIVPHLAKRFTVLQFGRKEYPDVPGCVRAPFVDLETLAAVYYLIGNYVGVNTGDHHLMIAVGGRAVVAEPDPPIGNHAEWWTYDSPRIRYGKLSNPKTMLNAIEELSL